MKLGRIMNARIENGRGTVPTTAVRRWALVLMAMLALGGCAGDAQLIGATTAGATTGASPLVEIERATWTAAPAGCEGMLDGLEWDFGVAAGAPELVVVLDPFGGAAVCTDTYSAVDAELRATGSSEVDSLWLSYVNTLQELEVYAGMNHSTRATRARDGSAVEVEDANDPLMGEPNPQPNHPTTPLPDMDPAENEPNPQPNMPGGEEGDDGSASSGRGSASSEPFRPNTAEPTEAVAPTVEAGGL